MNAPCPSWRDWILDDVSEALSEQQHAELTTHLASCSACRRYSEALHAEGAALAELAERFPRAGATEAVMCRVALLPPGGANSRWQRLLPRRVLRLTGIAAAVAIVVFGAFSALPDRAAPESGETQWWLAPSAAWGQQIVSTLEKMHAVTYHEQPIVVLGPEPGDQHVSGTTWQKYRAPDRQRTDSYYNRVLVSTDWEIPDGADLRRCTVSREYQCYICETVPGGAYRDRDATAWLCSYVERIGSDDRFLGNETIEDRACIGFELRPSPEGAPARVDRIWFDTATRLPVRIEEHGLPITDHPEQSLTVIRDRIAYHAEVPAELFEVVIPAGFINAHPDEVRLQRDATRSDG